MIEALAYAKEAHRLRSKLLQQKFVYSVEKMTERFDKDGVVVEKSYYGIQTFKVKDVLMVKGSCNYEDCVLTPWNVLSCYLESLLQVGVVQEILGNGSEAEMLLRWGRNISQYKSLPLFEIAFASMLGKLYRKQKLCCMAEKELSSAKKTLVDNRDIISCEKCASMLEVSINQQIGDVFLSSSCSTGESPLTERQLNAKSLYESALHKLNLSEWMSSISTSDEARADHVISRESSLSRCAINPSEENDTLPIDKPNKIEPRRSRRIKKENKPVPQRQDMACGHNRRITRSTNRSRGETSDTQNGCTAGLATEHVSESYSDNKMANVEAKSPFADFHSVMASVSNKMKCWHCLYIETVGCSSLNNFINLNWELAYRKLSLRLFLSIGKYFGICGDAHEAHKLLLQSMAVLFRRNSLCPRKICCELSAIGTTRIVSWLRLAFILSREVPVLFQKIARLLAAIYVLSTSLKPFSLSPNEEGSESLWASFFHQASLGTHLDQRIFFGMMQKKQSQIATDLEDSLLPNSTSTFSETPGSLRYARFKNSDYCAATLLLGCSSGSLYLKGSYIPHGAPISYLLAGSPVIVANLWEVTDKDIDRFGKAMLDAWLTERSAECDVSLNKCMLRKCNHRPRIGSFKQVYVKFKQVYVKITKSTSISSIFLVISLEHHQFVMVFPQV